MAVVTGPFLDTSVLVAGTIDLGPASAAAQAVLDDVAEGRLKGALTAWHCCLEFYAVSTRLPEEYRLSPEDARRLLDSEILGRFRIADLPEAARGPLFEAAERERVAGGRIYDAHIAETARRAGARLVLTENPRHFRSLTSAGIQVLSAAEFKKAGGGRRER